MLKKFKELKDMAVTKLLPDHLLIYAKPVSLSIYLFFKKSTRGNFLAVQWLGHCAFTVVGPGSIPGRGTKILQAGPHSQKMNE